MWIIIHTLTCLPTIFPSLIYNPVCDLIHVGFWDPFAVTISTFAQVFSIFLAPIYGCDTSVSIIHADILTAFHLYCSVYAGAPSAVYMFWNSSPSQRGISAAKCLLTKLTKSSRFGSSVSLASSSQAIKCACGKLQYWYSITWNVSSSLGNAKNCR